MKKFLLGLFCFSFILLCSGCGDSITDKKDIMKFLKKNYPSGNFEVMDITYSTYDCGDGTNIFDLASVTVYEKNMDIEFKVYEYVYGNEEVSCAKRTRDTYLDTLFQYYLSEINDTLLKKTDNGYFEVSFDEFSTKEECVNYLLNLKKNIFTKEPFKNVKNNLFGVNIQIYDENGPRGIDILNDSEDIIIATINSF